MVRWFIAQSVTLSAQGCILMSNKEAPSFAPEPGREVPCAISERMHFVDLFIVRKLFDDDQCMRLEALVGLDESMDGSIFSAIKRLIEDVANDDAFRPTVTAEEARHSRLT